MAALPVIRVFQKQHRGALQLVLNFSYNTDLINLVKTLPRARWSTRLKSWYILDSEKHLSQITSTFKDKAIIKLDLQNTKRPVRHLNTSQRQLLNGFYKFLRGKRYSKSTIDTYTFFVADFVAFYKNKTLETLTNRDVELYIESVFIKRKYSISTQRQFISALKLFIAYEPSTHIENLELVRPNKDKKLPNVLSKEEIIRLIASTQNLKHRAVITLLYSGGLRIGELINLRIEDFNFERKQIFIKNSKGRKDRYVTLADSFLPMLKNYLMTYKPQYYFVEGQPKLKYSASSIRKFLSKNVARSGIKTKVTPHVLRHSYATHLMEDGVGLRHIQVLLGHSKPETTMIYTHVMRKDLMNIKSPLDKAVEDLKRLDKAEQKFLLSRQ